jgi:hypothetical protein
MFEPKEITAQIVATSKGVLEKNVLVLKASIKYSPHNNDSFAIGINMLISNFIMINSVIMYPKQPARYAYIRDNIILIFIMFGSSLS